MLLVIGIVSCQKGNSNTNNKNVENSKLTLKCIEIKPQIDNQNLRYTGNLIPTKRIALSFQLPGSIVKINVDEGDFVKKGDVLAEIDPTTLKSAFKAAQATQKQAIDAYNRLKEVHDKGSLPDIQWEDVKSKLAQANSALAIAKQNLKHTKIVAPEDGVIGEKNNEVGNSILPGIPVMNILKLNDLYARISVPENEITKIKKGLKSEIKIAALGDNTFKAFVEKIGVISNPISRTYEVKLRLKNYQLMLKPGMACTADLFLNEDRNTIEIPYKVVSKDNNDETFVYKIDKNTHNIVKQNLTLGSFTNNNVRVESGLKLGDLIVLEGSHKVTEGMNVNYEIIK